MNSIKNTRELLLAHYRKYPILQIRDVFKFLFQSVFGCEHMVPSEERAISYITDEYENMNRDVQMEIEELDGNYSRVPLAYIDRGLSAETFGKLFCASAEKESGDVDTLRLKLDVARELAEEKLLPFDVCDFTAAVVKWENEGFPPVHHSDEFRNAYKPSYRLIYNDYLPFLPFFAELDLRLKKGKVNLAVEGGSASGKTTLGKLISKLYDCNIFHMDDFFLRLEQRTPERFAEAGGNVDRERFLEEVLLPLSRNEEFSYQKFDCSTMSLGEYANVTPKMLNVTEGAYSMHPDLAMFYDFSVMLDITLERQRARILKRNSPAFAERFFNEWIPMEQKYFSAFGIHEKCDMVISII